MHLWRSTNSPGTLYAAQGFEATEALYKGLAEDGFIVKLIHMATNAELREAPSHGSGMMNALAMALRPLQFSNRGASKGAPK